MYSDSICPPEKPIAFSVPIGYGSPPPAASWWSAPPAGRPEKKEYRKNVTQCRNLADIALVAGKAGVVLPRAEQPAGVPRQLRLFSVLCAVSSPACASVGAGDSGTSPPDASSRACRASAVLPDPAPARRHPAGRSRQVLLPCGALRRSAPAGRQAGCARSAGRSPVTAPWRAGGGRCPVPAPLARRYAPRRGRWRTACTDPQTPRPALCTHRRRHPARRRLQRRVNRSV